jgi:hypothetical protein
VAGTLKPGDLTAANFAGSMAEAIENALWALLPADLQFDKADTSAQAQDRRRLFVAIAQGVVQHLVDHADAFAITHTSGNDLTAAHKLQIGHTP